MTIDGCIMGDVSDDGWEECRNDFEVCAFAVNRTSAASVTSCCAWFVHVRVLDNDY